MLSKSILGGYHHFLHQILITSYNIHCRFSNFIIPSAGISWQHYVRKTFPISPVYSFIHSLMYISTNPKYSLDVLVSNQNVKLRLAQISLKGASSSRLLGSFLQINNELLLLESFQRCREAADGTDSSHLFFTALRCHATSVKTEKPAIVDYYELNDRLH